MNKVRKIAVLMAVFVLVLCFMAGCGKKKNTNTIDKNTIYKEEEINIGLPDNFDLYYVDVINNKLFFSGYSYDETTYESTSSWGTANLDGTGLTLNNLGANSWIDRTVAASDGSIYVFYSSYFEDYSDPDNYIFENHYNFSKCTLDGKVEKNIELSNEYEIYWIEQVFEVDGNVVLSANGNMYYFDSDLNFKSKKENNSSTNIEGIYTLKDGSKAAMLWGENGQELKRFDMATFETKDDITLPVSLYNISLIDCEGAGYDFILRDSTQVYGYNIGDESLSPIFNFINSDLTTSSFSSLTAIDDKTFIGSYYDYNDDGSRNVISRFTKVNPEDVKDKELISLGSMYMSSNLRNRVVQFNKSNDEYRIVAVDYSQYSTEDNWNAGYEKLNSDIASGQAPDIVTVDDYASFENYMSKGLFLDLTKYLEDDEEVNKDDIFPNLLAMSSYNGKMYAVVPEFYIQTLAAKTKNVNGKTSWTLQEMVEYEKSLKPDQKLFEFNNTRSNFTYNYFAANANKFVDMVNGKCYFDSQDFIDFLEYVKTLPEQSEDDYIVYDEMFYESREDAYRTDQVILSYAYISSVSEYKSLLRGTFGEDVTFIGYPTSEGNGSIMRFGSSYAINAKTANPKACWDFVKYYLTDEYQSSIEWSIPASMSRYDELGKLAQQKPFYMDGDEKIEYDDEYFVNGEWITVDPLTQADVDFLKEYIKTVDKVAGDIGELQNIIDEETAAFFEGQKTAEDVVKIIQSRATIYINERR